MDFPKRGEGSAVEMRELGIFSRTYETRNLEETYRRMAKHGLSHTQFNLSNAGLDTLPEHVEERHLREIREITDRYQIQLDALSGTFNMIDPDIERRRAGCRQFREQCRIAKELGIPVVTLCTGSKHPTDKWTWHEDNLSESAWEDLMNTTEEILRYAKEYDVILGVETEASNIVNTPLRARKYLDQADSPYLKIIMDGANLFRPEQVKDMRRVLDEAFALLGKDIVIAHAKDFSFREYPENHKPEQLQFVAAGQGVLDFSYYLHLLERCGYQGPLIMHGLSEEQVPESCRFLKEVMKDAIRNNP